MSYLWVLAPPTKEGWYAVRCGYDSGSVVDAAYWDGDAWDDDCGWHMCSPDTFPTEQEAEIWAWMHHPDGEMSEADARIIVEPAPVEYTLLPASGSYDPLKGGTFIVKVP